MVKKIDILTKNHQLPSRKRRNEPLPTVINLNYILFYYLRSPPKFFRATFGCAIPGTLPTLTLFHQFY